MQRLTVVLATLVLALPLFAAGTTEQKPSQPTVLPMLWREGGNDANTATWNEIMRFDKKVGYARYPGDLMISNAGRQYGDSVTLDHHTQAQLQGGVDWIKFLATPEIIKLWIVATGNLTPLVSLTADEKASLGPVNIEYLNAVEGVKQTIPWYSNMWDPIVQNEAVVKNLPTYLYGSITAEQYADALYSAAKQYHESLK